MSFKVKNAMTKTVVSIKPDATVDDACSLMLRHHISGMPVVDTEDRLIGIVTERDLLKLLFEAEVRLHRVREYLTKDVTTFTENDSLTEAAELFLDRDYRRVPVVRNGKLVGILARRDLIQFIRDLRIRVEKVFDQ